MTHKPHAVEDLKKLYNSGGTPTIIIIILGLLILVLAAVILAIYLYKKREIKYQRLRKKSLRLKPKLKISLPHGHIGDTITEKQVKFDSIPVEKQQESFVMPVTPVTPMTPNTPYSSSGEPKYPFNRSISAPAEKVFVSKDKEADDLWRITVKNAAATQFLTTKPKIERKVSHCANGKIKFSLKYNQLGQKELNVHILDFVDLPLSRETGISVPFVKVYLYPQTAHSYPATDVNKSVFRVEVLRFPQESSCSFIGCPIDKLCSSALKFVILDYDRFSRSEFVADCVILLDEVSLEGEAIAKHLSIKKMQPERDVGSLLLSLCYQPSGSRMSIIVLKSSGLPENDSGHLSDHFVKITLMRNGVILDKRRTRVIKKSICPVFNENLVFPVDCQSMRTLVLVFEVIRYDSKIKQEKIANVILGNHCTQRQVTPHEIQHFNEMLYSPQRQIAEWHKLVT